MRPPTALAAFAAALGIASLATSGPRAGAEGPVAHLQLDEPVAAQLADVDAGRALVFADRLGTAQVSRLADPLAVAPDPRADGYRAGDVAYWPAERTLVVFLTDGAAVPDGGLALVGRVAEGLDGLAGCARACVVGLAPAG